MAYFSDLVPRNLEHEFDLCVAKNTFSITSPTTDSEDTLCPICMEDITDKNKTTTACGHVFHSSCIFQNMMLRTSCPMCREDLICKQIPIASNTNSNTNINININYNLSQNNSQLMDIDDDIINALLSQDMLSQEILSQELYYNEPPINNNDDNETVNESESDSDSNSDSDSESDSDSDSHQELGNISGNSSVSEYDSSWTLPTLAAIATDDDDDDDDDINDNDDDDEDGFERFETDLSLSDVTNKMLELGYTSEDMFYYMTWRVNPFYFNHQYINKYNDEFYNTMTETMNKIFSKEIPIPIPIATNSELQYNSISMTIDELN